MSSLTCPCGLAIEPATKGLHRPNCPLDARSLENRIAQAIGDPGSVVPRRQDGKGGAETVTRWSTHAVMTVLEAETTLVRGLTFLDDAPPGEQMKNRPGGLLQCQTRAANADGVTFRCQGSAGHEFFSPPRRHNFVAETSQEAVNTGE